MNNGDFKNLYEELNQVGFVFSVENMEKHFKKAIPSMKFAFLQYVLARNETVNIHILICEMIMFTDVFFCDWYSVVWWHLKRALEISPQNAEVLKWIISTFDNHPDSPISEHEMTHYKNALNSISQ